MIHIEYEGAHTSVHISGSIEDITNEMFALLKSCNNNKDLRYAFCKAYDVFENTDNLNED